MDREELSSAVARMTAALGPVEGSSGDELAELERHLIAAVGGRGPAALRDLGVLELDDSDESAPHDAAAPRVLAREPQLETLLDLGLGRDPLRGLVPSRQLGPFSHLDGLLRWFSIYLPASALRVHIGSDARPALVLTSGRWPRFPSGQPTLDIEPGSVWIRADLLQPSAPSNAYAGFRVVDGKLTVPGGSAPTGGVLTISAPPLRLELSLAPAPPEPADPKCRGVSATIPDRLEITWSGGAVAASIGGGAAIIGGTTLVFAPVPAVAPSFDAGFNALVFPAAVTPASLDVSVIDSSIADLNGVTALDQAGWLVPLTTPSSPALLAEATGEGHWTAMARDPIVADWYGAERNDTVLHDARLLIAPHRLSLYSRAARPAIPKLLQRYALWRLPDSDHRLGLEVELRRDFDWVFVCDKSMGELVLMSGTSRVRVDRPLVASGDPIMLDAQRVLVAIQAIGGDKTLRVLGIASPGAGTTQALALENGLIFSRGCYLASVVGPLASPRSVDAGAASLAIQLSSWIPTLPDPYVTDWACTPPPPNRKLAQGTIWCVRNWTAAGAASCRFLGALPLPSQACRRRVAEPEPRHDDQKSVRLERTQAEQGARTRNAKQQEQWDRARAKASEVLAAHTRGSPAFAVRGREGATASIDLSAARIGTGPRLLDVSTQRHQIGVQLAPSDDEPNVAAPATTSYSLVAMRIVTPLSQLRVFTVPAVQWEPVRTLDADQDLVTLGYFPTPLASADDGGPTVIGSRSTTLIPTLPEIALDTMLEEFGDGRSMALVTTLPFGLKAALQLRPTPLGALPPDQALWVRPRFAQPPLMGGLQLSLRAAGGLAIPNEQSPSFEGVTVQQRNGVDLLTGAPLGISVLGATLGSAASVESMFNAEFAAARPRVPVTRLDLSGYGTSTFSDWTNPRGAFAEATKVQFEVLVGRTALEVVKFASVIYPWGIRVTRSVTIERRGGGGVIRRDSGWQASSAGLFDFRYQEEDPGAPGTFVERPSPFVLHPGLLRGLFDVQRIRPSEAPPIDLASTIGAVRVQPMYFDAQAKIDGAGMVAVRGVLGYLHVLPVGVPITAGDLATLLEMQPCAGGPLDVGLEVGTSRFRMRALALEVGVARPAAGPRFVGVVRGTPVFSSVGAWAICRMPGPTNTTAPPDATAVVDGVPLVREGEMGVPVGDELTFPAPQGDFRFAAAEDLLRPGSPSYDYGFVQSTPTHSFVFRRPTIAPGSMRIRSTIAPAVADIYARITAKGLFPPIANAIGLTDRPYELAVQPSTGFLRLDPPVSFPTPRAPLQISESSSQRLRVLYDETTLSLSITETDWSFSLPRLVSWTDAGAIAGLVGTRFDVSGSSTTRPQLTEIESLLNPDLEAGLTFVPGLSPRPKQGPVELVGSNLGLQGKVSLIARKEFKIGSYVAIEISVRVDLGGDSRTSADDPPSNGSDDFYIGAAAGVELQAKIPVYPIVFIVLGVAAEIGGKLFIAGALAGQGEAEVQFKVYAGVGVGTEVGPFEAYAFLAGGLVIQWDLVANEWHFGWLVLFEASFSVAVVKVKVNAECKGIQRRELRDGAMRDLVEYSGELVVNIELFWIISISFTWGISDQMLLPP